MILKSYDLKKSKLELNKIFLFYGKNEGFKNETINELLIEKKEVSHYDEIEILNSK
jgi:DNA polymerase-3 subunit delta